MLTAEVGLFFLIKSTAPKLLPSPFSPLRLQLAQARRDVRKHPDFKDTHFGCETSLAMIKMTSNTAHSKNVSLDFLFALRVCTLSVARTGNSMEKPPRTAIHCFRSTNLICDFETAGVGHIPKRNCCSKLWGRRLAFSLDVFFEALSCPGAGCSCSGHLPRNQQLYC